MDGSCTPEQEAGQEDPLLLDTDEELRLNGVDDDVLSLGDLSLGSLEEILFQALQHQTAGYTQPPEEMAKPQEVSVEPQKVELDQLPSELRGEVEAAAKKGKRLCFRRDVNGRCYRVRVSAAGQVSMRCLPEEREKCEDQNLK